MELFGTLTRSLILDHAQALCSRLQDEHEAAVASAHVEFLGLLGYLTSANTALTEEARRRYRQVVADARAVHDGACAGVQALHDALAAKVAAHNERVWPAVRVSRRAGWESGCSHRRAGGGKGGMGFEPTPLPCSSISTCCNNLNRGSSIRTALCMLLPAVQRPQAGTA